ncbi:MAG: nickel-dependent lactate racemase [Clostridiales bacterium]|nr:MAG: nickel-dependent lactate racemase [Clostridiales bacterium]
MKDALANPVGSKKLSELAAGKKNVVIIASDHTRPVPSKVIIPYMLDEIRKRQSRRGHHNSYCNGLSPRNDKRRTDKQIRRRNCGKMRKIYIHDCLETDKLVNIGTLPSGGTCEINSIAYNADLLVAEGFIEPHFFAGFSGGRKSVLPGIASRTTVMANHCSEFIADKNARTGILENNPIHKDMLWAAKAAKLAFIVNVVLDADKKVIYAVAGDSEQAHKKGTDFLSKLCGAKAVDADIAISTNGGYPLDQNVYQAVKGMTAAEATVKDGGVIIMLASSSDGTGGDNFYHQLADEEDIKKTTALFLSRGRNETAPDQWQSQILLRILSRASVIYISEMPDDMVKKMHMIPSHSLDDAMKKAREILGKTDIKIAAIPDGVSVIVEK